MLCNTHTRREHTVHSHTQSSSTCAEEEQTASALAAHSFLLSSVNSAHFLATVALRSRKSVMNTWAICEEEDKSKVSNTLTILCNYTRQPIIVRTCIYMHTYTCIYIIHVHCMYMYMYMYTHKLYTCEIHVHV